MNYYCRRRHDSAEYGETIAQFTQRLRRSAPEPETEPVEDKLAALAEERGLTRREADVLREYLAGKSRTEIGQSLFISESTVKNHVSSIFSKLGVKNRRELLELAGKNK